MNAATQQALSNRPAQDAKARRDLLITGHLHLVTAVAAHIQRSIPVHTELDDLTHAGTMGLFDAATKYQEDKDVSFPTYAKHRIRGAILDSLRQQDWASRDLRKRYKQVQAITLNLTTKLGRAPSEREIAEAMGLCPKRWQALMVDFRNLNAASMQSRAVENDDQVSPEIPDNSGQTPHSVLARAELRDKLRSAMETLPEKYRLVVKMYYENDLSMKEIGQALGVNESRVSQINKAALRLMQTSLSGLGICSAAAF